MAAKPHDRRCGAFNVPCDCVMSRWQLLVLLSNGVQGPAAGTVDEISPLQILVEPFDFVLQSRSLARPSASVGY